MNTHKAMKYAVAVLFLVASAGTALASPAEGTNPNLPASGEIFIPLAPASSGVLGDPLGGGDLVGLQVDSMTVSGIVAAPEGDVSFELAFDISADIDPLNPIVNNGVLFLTFRDLDFKRVVANTLEYTERLELRFAADAGDPLPIAPDLVLHEGNYGDYADPHVIPPAETNETLQTYMLDMRLDLGVTNAEWADITTDNDFIVELTLISHVDHTRVASNTYGNTPESVFANDFTFIGVPEPATLMVLALGSAFLMPRRRRRQ